MERIAVKKDWSRLHMARARLAASASKDTTKVGAALISTNGKSCILDAFNGPPAGVHDHVERFNPPAKYLYASHAEENLIAFAAREGIRTAGCSIIVTHGCCCACARMIIQAGIVCVTAGPGITRMPPEQFEAARQMFEEAGVEYRKVDY